LTADWPRFGIVGERAALELVERSLHGIRDEVALRAALVGIGADQRALDEFRDSLGAPLAGQRLGLALLRGAFIPARRLRGSFGLLARDVRGRGMPGRDARLLARLVRIDQAGHNPTDQEHQRNTDGHCQRAIALDPLARLGPRADLVRLHDAPLQERAQVGRELRDVGVALAPVALHRLVADRDQLGGRVGGET
jgi:hypothetical protein